ncbi:MAG: hypothetical protein HZA13_08075 [Nitrospirae bacterium]|nr:hypothetical protein [Nitrospirota bacterium]
MNGESPDIKQANLQKLKGLFPELFTENQVDWEKLKAAFGDDVNFAHELIIALDAMHEKLIEQIISSKPQKIITLDSLFTGNDQLKTNTVLQMRDAGVDFKMI